MRFRGFLALLAALVLLVVPASAHTREEVRARYRAICDWSEGGLYAREPSVVAPYATGAVREDALEDALDYLNFLRWLAGLDAVELSPQLTDIVQYGAVLSAANDFVSHDPSAPADMPGAFYEEGRYAARSSNIARLNWMSEDVLREAVEYFARDDGEANLSTLGHRRWLLNPRMASTGFGLASARSGVSYVTMYAHDLQGETGDWEYVAWPAAGAFPAELMSAELAWSLVLNPEVFDVEGAWVTLTELETGAVYGFPGDNGYFRVDEGAYGAGPCLIFRPGVKADYQQNQRWRVEAGNAAGASVRYEVEMISLYPEKVVSVEVSPREATLFPGETLLLSAAAIPDWADDLTVRWESGNAAVATVKDGLVTAIAPGSCEIRAVSVDGPADVCTVTVK